MQVNETQIIEDLQAMIRIPSVNPDLDPDGTGEAEIAQWLQTWCVSRGLKTQLQMSAPNRPNLIARWEGKGDGKSILLTGHTDTVSVKNMDIDPFDSRIEDGRMYGRGSYDMKAGLASILGAVDALQASDFQPAGDIILAFVTDEEYASIGTSKLVEEVHADAAILTEPTETQLCIAHKGFAWITLETEGRAAHGSRYDLGTDAILHMNRLLTFIERLETDILVNKTHPLLARPSVHASGIEGGLGWSTFPERCVLKVEHRLLPDETGETYLAMWQGEIQRLMQADPKFSATATLELARPGYEIPRESPIVRATERAFQKVMGKPPTYYGMWAWLDSAILGPAGIPTVILGAGGAGAHAAVEYVELAEVFHCAEIIAETVHSWTA